MQGTMKGQPLAIVSLFAVATLGRTSAALAADGPTLPERVSTLLCAPTSTTDKAGQQPHPLWSLVNRAITELESQGVVVPAPDTDNVCAAAAAGGPLPVKMPELVVHVSQIGEGEQARIAFRPAGSDVVITILGRRFVGAFAANSMLFPWREARSLQTQK